MSILELYRAIAGKLGRSIEPRFAPERKGDVRSSLADIGREMDVRYRETAGGGLAATPTGRRLARERLVQIKRS